MKEFLKRQLPKSWYDAMHRRWMTIKYERDRKTLAALPRATGDVSVLRDAATLRPSDIFHAEVSPPWRAARVELITAGVGDLHGGVNPGDQRAIYELIRFLKPRAVLEFGTHVGASTSHIALALRQLMDEDPTTPRDLVTVDIIDVNDTTLRHWEKFNSPKSPKAIVDAVGAGHLVTFVVEPGLEFARKNTRKFDLIFLDGNHAAQAVYEEIPAALKMLAPDGVILLHDYFPDNKPLWPDARPIQGPVLAVQKLRSDGLDLEVIPLGALPWSTKKGTNVTSLALAARPSSQARTLSAVA